MIHDFLAFDWMIVFAFDYASRRGPFQSMVATMVAYQPMLDDISKRDRLCDCQECRI